MVSGGVEDSILRKLGSWFVVDLCLDNMSGQVGFNFAKVRRLEIE